MMVDGGANGMMDMSPHHMQDHYRQTQEHNRYMQARKSYGGFHGMPNMGRASGASSPEADYHQQQKFYSSPPQQHYTGGFRSDGYPDMIPPQEHRRESLLVILDGHGLNKRRNSVDKRIPLPSVVAEESEDDTGHALFDNNMNAAAARRIKQMHQQVSDNDDADESEMDDEERRRYVKRQRHRSLIDADGVHEIRFDNISTEASSASESSSPKSGEEHDDEDEIIMIDASGGVDNGSRRNLMEIDMEREGDAARVLEDMKLYTAGLKKFLPSGLKGGSAIRRQGSQLFFSFVWCSR